MKYSPYSHCFTRAALLAAAVAFLPALGRAQTTQTWEGGVGGNPTIWDMELSQDWDGSPGAGWSGGNDTANFTNASASNVVTVDSVDTVGFAGPLTVNEMFFNQPGNWMIEAQADAPGSTPYDRLTDNYITEYNAASGTHAFVQMSQGSGNVTISAPIEISDLGSGEQTEFRNDTNNASLTIGSIDIGAYTANPALNGGNNTRRISFEDQGGASTITLDGTYTASAANGNGGSLTFSEVGGSGASVYNIASTADFTGFGGGGVVLQSFAGTFNIASSHFAVGQNIALDGAAGTFQAINLVGATTIAANGFTSQKNGGTKQPDGVSINGQAIVNQSTANTSTWQGSWNQDGTNMTVSAVSGGRLVFAGNIGGNSPLGLTVTGTGTVVLASAGGNSYNEDDGNGNYDPSSGIAADLKSGTTLITNTSGSAFGQINFNNNGFYGNGGPHSGTVNVEASATLGGSGISAPVVKMMAANAVLAPGDSGSDGGTASIGTLHLTGGVQATSGLTMDFKLTTPGASDSLDLGAGAFTLGGHGHGQPDGLRRHVHGRHFRARLGHGHMERCGSDLRFCASRRI